jgi:hypothetical protein
VGGGTKREQWLSWRSLILLAVVVMPAVGTLGVIDRARWEETDTRRTDPPPEAGSRVPTEVAGAVELKPSAMVPVPIEHLAVVRVSVTRCGERAFGSGVLIDNGLVVTAGHVVGDAGLVRLDQGGVTVTGEVRGVLADGRDLALIEVDGPLDGPIASAGIPRAGSPVTVAGHPGGAGITTVVGEKVELAVSVASIARGPAFGVAVTTGVGMSGGPAIDEAGRLVGVIIGAETGSGTAIVAAVDDAGKLAREALTEGRCPITA